MSPSETEEAVARIIDPDGWRAFDRFLDAGGLEVYGTRDRAIAASANAPMSLTKARTILAFLAAQPETSAPTIYPGDG